MGYLVALVLFSLSIFLNGIDLVTEACIAISSGGICMTIASHKDRVKSEK